MNVRHHGPRVATTDVYVDTLPTISTYASGLKRRSVCAECGEPRGCAPSYFCPRCEVEVFGSSVRWFLDSEGWRLGRRAGLTLRAGTS